MKMTDELAVPAAAADHQEILRVFSSKVKGPLIVSLLAWYENPRVWGIVIADLVQHVANAYGGDDQDARGHVRQQVLAILRLELDRPTSAAEQIKLD